MNKNTKKLINYSKKQLDDWEKAGVKVAEDQINFYMDLIDGLCPTCKKKLNVFEYELSENTFRYKFSCGHNFLGISLSDSLSIRSSIGLKQKRKGYGLLNRSFHGYKPSGDPRLTEGVNIDMTVDRENNEYHQKVVDNKTGKVLHEEHESLIDHSIKQKQKLKEKK